MSYTIVCCVNQQVKKTYTNILLEKLSLFDFFNASRRFPGKTDNIIKIDDDNYEAIICLLNVVFYGIYHDLENIPYHHIVLAADRLILRIPLLCFFKNTITYDVKTVMSIIKKSDELNTLLYLIYLGAPLKFESTTLTNYIRNELENDDYEINYDESLTEIIDKYTEFSVTKIKNYLSKIYSWPFILKTSTNYIVVITKAIQHLIKVLFIQKKYDILDLLYINNSQIKDYINEYLKKVVNHSELIIELTNTSYIYSAFAFHNIDKISYDTDREVIYNKLIEKNILDNHFISIIIKRESDEFLNKFVGKNYNHIVLSKIIKSGTLEILVGKSLDVFLTLRIVYDTYLIKPDINYLEMKMVALSRIPTLEELKEHNLFYHEIIEMLLLFFFMKTENYEREEDDIYKIIEFLNIPHIDLRQEIIDLDELVIVCIKEPTCVLKLLEKTDLFVNYPYGALTDIIIDQKQNKTKITVYNFNKKQLNPKLFNVIDYIEFDISNKIYQNDCVDNIDILDKRIMLRDNYILIEGQGRMYIPISEPKMFLHFMFEEVAMILVSNGSDDFVLISVNNKLYCYEPSSNLIPILLKKNFITNIFTIMGSNNIDYYVKKSYRGTLHAN